MSLNRIDARMVKDTDGKTISEKLGSLSGTVDEHTTQLAHTTTDLNSRGIVAEKFSTIQEGINHLANNGGGELILSKSYAVSETIRLKRGVTLNFIDGAELKVVANVNVLELERNTKIKGIARINTNLSGWNKSAIRLLGSDRMSQRDVSIDYLWLVGRPADGMGNAIHFDCSTIQSDISFVTINEAVIRGFEKGVFMDAPPVDNTLHNYVNGNTFNSLIISDCTYYIYCTGDKSANTRNQVDGNQFKNVSLQYNARAVEMVHIEGLGNIVEGVVWDASKSTSEVLITNLTQTSNRNTITFLNAGNPTNFKNLGNVNHISFGDNQQGYVPYKQSVVFNPTNYRNYFGDYEDILHRSDVVNTVTTLTGGGNVTSGSLSNIFDGRNHQLFQLNLSEDKEFSFEIDFTKGNYVGSTTPYLYSGFNALGFHFTYNECPKKLFIEVTDHNDAIVTTEINTEDARFLPAQVIRQNSVNGLGRHIKKLKITMRGQVANRVSFGRMFGNSYNVGGNKYISNAGGLMAANLEFLRSSDGIILRSSDGGRHLVRVNNTSGLTVTKL